MEVSSASVLTGLSVDAINAVNARDALFTLDFLPRVVSKRHAVLLREVRQRTDVVAYSFASVRREGLSIVGVFDVQVGRLAVHTILSRDALFTVRALQALEAVPRVGIRVGAVQLVEVNVRTDVGIRSLAHRRAVGIGGILNVEVSSASVLTGCARCARCAVLSVRAVLSILRRTAQHEDVRHFLTLVGGREAEHRRIVFAQVGRDKAESRTRCGGIIGQIGVKGVPFAVSRGVARFALHRPVRHVGRGVRAVTVLQADEQFAPLVRADVRTRRRGDVELRVEPFELVDDPRHVEVVDVGRITRHRFAADGEVREVAKLRHDVALAKFPVVHALEEAFVLQGGVARILTFGHGAVAVDGKVHACLRVEQLRPFVGGLAE